MKKHEMRQQMNFFQGVSNRLDTPKYVPILKQFYFKAPSLSGFF